jgi:hypothetical protein
LRRSAHTTPASHRFRPWFPAIILHYLHEDNMHADHSLATFFWLLIPYLGSKHLYDLLLEIKH